MSLTEVIGKKFGVHRGLPLLGHEPNSLKAIGAAVDLEPIFVEFDVVCTDSGVIKMGHPPQRPLDKLIKVLSLFEGKRKTYPKIDIKLTQGKHYPDTIDTILGLLNQYDLHFVLVNLGHIKGRENIMEAEKYFAQKVKDSEKYKLNINLTKYRPPGGEIDDGIKEHVENLGGVIHSVSPEIHEEDTELSAKFADETKIHNVYFWLRGWPDVVNPNVKEEEIMKALELEKRYDVKVLFDFNPIHIEDFDFIKNMFRKLYKNE